MFLCQRKSLKDHYFFIDLFLFQLQLLHLLLQHIYFPFALISFPLHDCCPFLKHVQPCHFPFQLCDPSVPLRVFLPLSEEQIWALKLILAEIFIDAGDLLTNAVVDTLLVEKDVGLVLEVSFYVLVVVQLALQQLVLRFYGLEFLAFWFFVSK